MKITVLETTIEATAEEIRQSNTLADGLTRILRSAFNNVNPPYYSNESECDDEDEEDL